ncbi:MAG: GNAT family N-acetyltransferase [Alphaproteobacteria bacterium]
MDAIRPVSAAALGRYAALLCRLDPVDRRLRFGRVLDDEAILDHVDGLARRGGLVIGAWHGLLLHGAAEIARTGDGVEIALAVAAEARGAGLGRALLEAALARVAGCAVIVTVLAENRAMRALAASAGFVPVRLGPDMALRRPAEGPTTIAA